MKMTVHQNTYTKEEFIKFLEKNNVSDIIINKFKELPETVKRRDKDVFDLYVSSLWHGEGKTFYEFEINYYSENLIEYLFSSKVFRDVEYSINNVLCEIKKLRLPKK